MKALTITAILLVIITSLMVAGTATMFETGFTQQNAYAKRPCADGYHWDADLHTCVSD